MTLGQAQNRLHDREPLDARTISYGDDLRRLDAEMGCERLREATQALYEREALRRGIRIDHSILAMQQGPEAAALWARARR